MAGQAPCNLHELPERVDIRSAALDRLADRGGIVEVPAGTTVTWKFRDGSVPHDVKADGFNSGEPQRSGSFAHTFATPGSYDYVCTLHPQMTGRVVVTPKQ